MSITAWIVPGRPQASRRWPAAGNHKAAPSSSARRSRWTATWSPAELTLADGLAGESVNTPTGRRQGGPSAAPGRAMRTGTGIFLIAADADLRFAVVAGSPHGLNVHFVGVVLIPAGVLCSLLPLLLSLLFTGVNAAFFGLNATVAGELLGAPGRRADLNRLSSAPVQP